MIIEMKVEVPSQLRNVNIKDMLELLVYVKYVMDDDKLSKMCGVLSDTNTWHCLKVRANESGKLQVLKYIYYEAEREEDLLGFLPSVHLVFDSGLVTLNC